MEAHRHITMSAINALIAIRRYRIEFPMVEPSAAAASIKNRDADYSGSDFEAALSLHDLLPAELAFSEISSDLKRALTFLLTLHQPWWLRVVPYGRERLVAATGGVDLDQLQCLRAAGLFDDPPDEATVTWWDELAHIIRTDRDQRLLNQGRQGERLSLAYERERLRKLGISAEPKWVSIEDNGAGYDIRSFTPGPIGPLNRLIEVKSSARRNPRIFISRNEWESALLYGNSYVFHIWHLPTKTLLERTVADMEPNIPINKGSGWWTNVEIDIACD
jgi:Domain of unknown function (DUF3883)